jgi:hypothetical protein
MVELYSILSYQINLIHRNRLVLVFSFQILVQASTLIIAVFYQVPISYYLYPISYHLPLHRFHLPFSLVKNLSFYATSKLNNSQFFEFHLVLGHQSIIRVISNYLDYYKTLCFQ